MDINDEIERLDQVLSTVHDTLESLPQALESVAGVDYAAHLRPIVTSHYLIEKAVEDLRGIAGALLAARVPEHPATQ